MTLYLSDVHVGYVGQEVVAHEETHQDPVINDLLEIVVKWQLILHSTTPIKCYTSGTLKLWTP